jgi:hypothetical protein
MNVKLEIAEIKAKYIMERVRMMTQDMAAHQDGEPPAANDIPYLANLHATIRLALAELE